MMVRPVEVHSAHDGFSAEAKDAIHKKGNFLLFINAPPASDGSAFRTQFSVPVSKMPLLTLLHFRDLGMTSNILGVQIFCVYL